MPEKTRPRKKKHAHAKNTRNPLLIPFIFMCLLVVIMSGSYIVNYYKEEDRTEETNAQLLSLLHTPTPTEENPEAAETPVPTETPVPKLEDPDDTTVVVSNLTASREIDSAFTELYAINPDLVGRVRASCGNAPIDLMVVQRDNSFYLTHDFYGEPHKAGTVFLDQSNVIWPQDQHMLLYGHNMKNGTMFARLTRYASLEFATYNPFIYFDTLYEQNTYVIIAALRMTASEMQSESFNIRTFIFGKASFDAFVYQIGERALYFTAAGVNSDDQLLSLVTCSYSENDERFLLVTRKLREGETEEELSKLLKNKFNGKG